MRAKLQQLLRRTDAARTAAENTVYGGADADVTPPHPLSRQFPEGAPIGVPPARVGTLELIVGKAGDVEFVKLHTPLNRYHERMIVSAVKAWRYSPALRAGKPVRFRLTVTIVPKQVTAQASAHPLQAGLEACLPGLRAALRAGAGSSDELACACFSRGQPPFQAFAGQRERRLRRIVNEERRVQHHTHARKRLRHLRAIPAPHRPDVAPRGEGQNRMSRRPGEPDHAGLDDAGSPADRPGRTRPDARQRDRAATARARARRRETTTRGPCRNRIDG